MWTSEPAPDEGSDALVGYAAFSVQFGSEFRQGDV